jgi:hypothetical protein
VDDVVIDCSWKEVQWDLLGRMPGQDDREDLLGPQRAVAMKQVNQTKKLRPDTSVSVGRKAIFTRG